MAGPRGLAGGPRKSWLWIAALQGSACFVGLAAACERTENGFLLLTARRSAGRSNQGMQRISHLSYYTTPAVGKSRTAATGRSGWAEAADRFARAALCLRLLYHKTLSTGTKTRGKYGSCLKKHPEFRKRFRAFFRESLLSEQALFRGELSIRENSLVPGRILESSGKVLRLREKLLFRENRGQEETPLGFLRHGEAFGSGETGPSCSAHPNAAGEKRTLLQAIQARARNSGQKPD